MNSPLATLTLLAAALLFTVSCANQVAVRGPASLREIEGRSIPENSLSRTKSVSFAFKENGIKLMELSSLNYEAPAAKYVAEIDGVFSGAILSATGEHTTGYKNGDDSITRKRPGKAKYKNIILRKAYDGKSGWLEWYKKVLTGSGERKSGSIIILNDKNEEVRISFDGAYPTRWKAPELNSGSDYHGVEEIEFVTEKIEID